jgi:peptidyl-prolyl cis-trans isomerase B (cyclophilin B)
MKRLLILMSVVLGLAGMVSARAEDPKPADKPAAAADEVAVLKFKDYGDIVLEFFPDVAPKTVENFKKLTREKFYNGTQSHRLIPGFMIQLGDPFTKDPSKENRWGTGDPGFKIKAEFNGKPHVKGIVSMARSADPDSAGSQFFICFDTAPHLDRQYTVFARVLSGMEVLEKLEKAPQRGSKPQTPVVLESVTLLARADLKPAAK